MEKNDKNDKEIKEMPKSSGDAGQELKTRKMKKERSQKVKQLIELIICIIIVMAAVGIGNFTGMFDSLGEAFQNTHFDVSVIISLFVMVFAVLAVEKLAVLILGLFKRASHRTATVITITQSIIRYGSAIVALCWGLAIIGVNISTIAASVGIVTLIVGFGAESLIEDVITGLFMIFENQYNVGDIVEVSGFRGTVSDIGIRTTSIMDTGGNVKIINNSNMKDILNRSDNISKSVTDIQIPYETDLVEFEKKIPGIMEEIYALHKDKMKSIPQYFGVQELGESGVTLRFGVEVDEANIYAGQRILNHDLFVFFRRENVECPFPQIDVHQK